ncbi:MAG: hypothetical protein RQM92_06790 [Candidatus Syntrophopropionicum ammoniitolerans]
MSTPEIKKQIDEEMVQRQPNWFEHLRENIGPAAPDKYHTAMSQAGIADYYIDHSPIGLWVVIKKNNSSVEF